MCTTFPKCWPHGFTTMLSMCDRYTAERFVFFQVSRDAVENASSLRSFQYRVGHRLKDGFVYRWFTDDEIGFDGPEVNEVTKSLTHYQP